MNFNLLTLLIVLPTFIAQSAGLLNSKQFLLAELSHIFATTP